MDFLTLTIFLPLVGVVLILLLRKEAAGAIRVVALVTSLATFAISLPLFFMFDPTKGAQANGLADLLQFTVEKQWIETFNIWYRIGLDGISLLLVMLTTFLTPLCIWASFKPITQRIKGYYIAFLVLETGMLGVFASVDLVLFYVFWEAMLIPMYLLIGVWGGPNRIYAAVKFILYTIVGSLLMLVGILWLYFNAVPGVHTFDLAYIMQMGDINFDAQLYLFAAFALAFAIKVPMFPFHTWLPDAHVEAPTAGSMVLAAILLKMGTYGFIRFCIPLFPDAAHHFAGLMMVLAIIGIVYGALVSMMQVDMKKLVAYSSVSHLGFVVLGLFSFKLMGMQGGTIQMINHGLSTGALFFLVGVIYDRRHTRMISEYGGLAKVMPKYATLFMIVALSSIGLPGLNGFIGEFLVLLGAFQAHAAYGIFAATGVVFAAVYLLWMYQRVFFGEVTKDVNKKLTDLTLAEKIILIAMLVFIVWIGVHPNTFLSVTENSVQMVLTRLGV